ncbi:MAG: hypothetical protein JWP29_2394 [Rhodoferax sp.]|nr:hypothetical protein [Rhodoferax sp.]
MAWVMRLAWMAINAIAMLPVLGRWFDPAPVRDPNARPATLSVLLDVLGAVSHRAWGLPAIVALSVFVVSLTATAYATLAYRGVPWSRRNHVLWPLPGLGVALAICTLLDEHLPEFGR